MPMPKYGLDGDCPLHASRIAVKKAGTRRFCCYEESHGGDQDPPLWAGNGPTNVRLICIIRSATISPSPRRFPRIVRPALSLLLRAAGRPTLRSARLRLHWHGLSSTVTMPHAAHRATLHSALGLHRHGLSGTVTVPHAAHRSTLHSAALR